MTRMLDFEDFKREYQKVPVEEHPNNVMDAVPEPMVSVKISTYQHADFIRDCLDGVLMQETDFPVEILIGEDESDDGTREICKEYADRHPDKIRLFLHRRENNIKIHGRPTGRFQSAYTRFKCRGKYIAMCEGDDYWRDPEKLQKQIEFLEANPSYVLSYHEAIITDKYGNLIGEYGVSEKFSEDIESRDLRCGPVLPALSLCYKNKFTRVPSEYFRVLNGDIMLIALLGEHGKGHYQQSVKPAAYRRHEGGMWTGEDEVFAARARMHTARNLIEYCRRKGWARALECHKFTYIDFALRRFNLVINKGNYSEAFMCAQAIILTFTKYYRKNIKSVFSMIRIVIGHSRKKVSDIL